MKVLYGRAFALPYNFFFFRKIKLYLYIINVNRDKAFHPNAISVPAVFVCR